MSTELHEQVDEQQVMLVRTFDAVMSQGDGRTLDLRIVPYNTPAVVADPPNFTPYREAFAPGAFERQIAVPGRMRVWLNFEHEEGLRGIVGHGIELREEPDALTGSFRVHENTDGDKALQLVNEGLLTGVSMEFKALRSRTIDGVVQRLRAHIDRVALCRSPAYDGAAVLAVREEPPVVDDETPPDPPTPEPVPDPDPDRRRSNELSERLAALGVEPLMRMAVTTKPWDGSASRYTDEQYQRAALFCRSGEGPVKELCSLPVLEPDGMLNANALGAAAGALAGARSSLRNVTRAEKAAAARKLVRMYAIAKMTPPSSLVRLARS